MKVLLGASIVCVFIEFQNLFSIQNQWTNLIFTRPRVVFARNSYTVLYEESKFTFTFAQKSIDNIFKMVSLSVKRSIQADWSLCTNSCLLVTS